MRCHLQLGLQCGLLAVAAAYASYGQVVRPAKLTDDIAGAQTVSYCEILEHPETFRNKTIRVRALYETDFERAAITAPSCDTPIPMTWVEFEKGWESRTTSGIKHAIAGQKWRIQTDVVFIGVFRTDGHYGHMDMYPFLIEVYKVEAVRPSASFRPLPERQKKSR